MPKTAVFIDEIALFHCFILNIILILFYLDQPIEVFDKLNLIF